MPPKKTRKAKAPAAVWADPPLDAEQLGVLGRLGRGCSLVLGSAGSGKSVLLRAFEAERRARCAGGGDSVGGVLTVAPTALTALHARGETLHRGLKLPRPGTSLRAYVQFLESCGGDAGGPRRPAGAHSKAYTAVEAYFGALDDLVVDAFNQVSAETLETVDDLLRLFRGDSRPFGGLRVTAFGDLLQLSPPGPPGGPAPRLAVQSARWASWNFQTFQLTRRSRHPDMAELLERAGRGVCDGADLARLAARGCADDAAVPAGVTRLLYSVARADEANAAWLAALPGETFVFEASVRFRHAQKALVRSDFFVRACEQVLEAAFKARGAWLQQTLRLKVGARVMLREDLDATKGLRDGVCGTVTEVSAAGEVKVQWAHGPATTVVAVTRDLPVRAYDGCVSVTQLPLVLGWALCVTQAHGLALPGGVAVDAGWAPSAGHAHLVWGRVESLQGLHLVGELDLQQLRADPVALAFLAGRSVAAQPLARVPPPPRRAARPAQKRKAPAGVTFGGFGGRFPAKAAKR